MESSTAVLTNQSQPPPRFLQMKLDFRVTKRRHDEKKSPTNNNSHSNEKAGEKKNGFGFGEQKNGNGTVESNNGSSIKGESVLEEIAVEALLSTKSQKRSKQEESPEIEFGSDSSTTPSQILDESAPVCILQDSELWTQFDAAGNEMIITKNGRCLFPVLKFGFLNLPSEKTYSVSLDFVLLSPFKFRYKGNGKWNPMIQQQEDVRRSNRFWKPVGQIYKHPDSGDSGQSGSFWVQKGANFSHVKLTNRLISSSETEKGLFSLASFHLYQPRLILTEIASNQVWTFLFENTKFIAVTHYQNSNVNTLKKNYNPHAKGFKEMNDLSELYEQQ